MSTQKKQPVNPFVYVLAAAVIAVLFFWVRYVIDALDSREEAIQQESDYKNYLVPKKAKVETTTTGTTAPVTGDMQTGAIK